MSTLRMIGGSVLIGQGARVTFKIFNNLASRIPITISSACQEEFSLPPFLPISISLPLSPLLLCSLLHPPPPSLFLFYYKIHVCSPKFKRNRSEPNKISKSFSTLSPNKSKSKCIYCLVYISSYLFKYILKQLHI